MRGLFIGLSTIDLQFLVDSYPKSNIKVKALHHEINIGGPATNAAIAYAHLGGTSLLVTGIGKNHFTNLITEEILKYGISYVDFTPDCDASPTFASIITSKENGDRTVFSYNPDNKHISVSVLESINIEDFDIVLIDGFHPKAALPIIKKANNEGIPVVYDGGSWKDYSCELLDYIDIAICSNDFFPPNCYDKQDTLKFLSEEKGINKVAITRGQDTIIFSDNNIKGKIQVYDSQIVDTLGAGDIFHGAFCYYYCLNKTFEKSLQLASGIATESCKHFGTRSWMKELQ